MVSLDLSSVANRVRHGLEAEFEMICFELAKGNAERVESEIELMVLTTLDIIGRLTRLRVTIGDDLEEGAHVLVTPQFKWNGYRIDFCLRTRGRDRFVFVECDGHDFHERTKEQAERDRSKDRAIQAAGIPILRFTGREIYRDPAVVAVEIINFLGTR